MVYTSGFLPVLQLLISDTPHLLSSAHLLVNANYVKSYSRNHHWHVLQVTCIAWKGRS